MPDPLHVQTAAALGWTNLHERTGGHWWGREPHGGLTITVPRYDTSWCSCGPILQRLNICLSSPNEIADQPSGVWDAYLYTGEVQSGKTPCEAVAKLIVELDKTEKLPK